MFENDYKKAMDSISADTRVKEKVLKGIQNIEEEKTRKNPAIAWRVAFACVACAAIVFGVMFVPRDTFKPPVQSETQVLQVSKSYDEIYKLIKPKNDILHWDPMFDGAIDDSITYEGDIEFDADMEEGTGTTASKHAVQYNGAVKDENAASIDKSESELAGKDFSDTTEQVEGVSEADIVKTDGEYIYYLNETHLSIFTADGKNAKLLSQTKLSEQTKNLYGEMFLKDDRLVIIKTDHHKLDEEFVLVVIYDISDPESPKKLAESCQEGWYNTSRMVGDYIYLISNCHINISTIDKDDPTTFVPVTETNGVCEAVPADSIYRYEKEEYTNSYTVIGAFNYKDGTLSDTASLLGGTDNVYCSQGNIILADTVYNNDSKGDSYSLEKTVVSQLAIKEGIIEYKTSGEVDGSLDNQFFIDEHNGYFRFVTTVTQATEKRHKFENSDNEVVSYSQDTFARLTVLDGKLKKVGEIKDLAQGERVYSVRFMGDTAYFVTFRQTDPLFSADLSDPQNPKILGELKIPGFSEYMYPYGDGLLLGFGMDADERTGATRCLKLSMFNITDPANVTEDDKTLVEGYAYSPALSDHKAMLVSPDKNLIGFAATNNYDSIKYLIYKYTGDGFDQVATLEIKGGYNYYAMTDVRGLFIGDEFYVVSEKQLQIFDINKFSQIAKIEF